MRYIATQTVNSVGVFATTFYLLAFIFRPLKESLGDIVTLQYRNFESDNYDRGSRDIITVSALICGIETIRSVLDWIIFKAQRRANLSYRKKEKLSTTMTLLAFYTIGYSKFILNS